MIEILVGLVFLAGAAAYAFLMFFLICKFGKETVLEITGIIVLGTIGFIPSLIGVVTIANAIFGDEPTLEDCDDQ